MNKLHYEILLASRHIRKDSLNSKWINEYMDEIKQQLDIEELFCIVTNSLERKIALTSIADSNYLIFDNYLIELFDYIDFLFDNKNLRCNGISKLFYKILAENYYIDEYFSTFLLMHEYYTKINLSYSQFSQREECLFCQQSYLFFHELEHYLILQNKAILDDGSILELFYKRINEEELSVRVIEFLSKRQSVEEMSCDIEAAIEAIAVAYDKYHTDPVILAQYVMVAQYNMFLISIIDDQSKYKIKSVDNFDLLEYRIRLINLKLLLPEIIESIYGLSGIKVHEYI